MYNKKIRFWSVFIGVCVLVFGGLVWFGVQGDKEKARLMEQCMQDHKEYECVALLRDPTPPAPIIIPVIQP